MQFEQIKGFGQKRIQKLKEAGLNNPADLLTIFPYKYVFPGNSILNFVDKQEVSVFAVCVEVPILKYVRKGLSLVRATFKQGEQTFSCVWFNQPYVKKQLIVGKIYAIIGKIKKVGKKTDVYVSSLMAVASYNEVATIYKPYNKIPSKIIKDAILQVLDSVKVEGRISDEFCRFCGLLSLNSCLKTIHLPQDKDSLCKAKRDASLQILAYNLAEFTLIKGQNLQNKAKKYVNNSSILRNVINSLPYTLTDDQTQALKNIIEDFHSDRRMNRLLEGDVGCGKTIVAFLAMYYVALSGYQAALMAPTEILAKQHYAKALEFFGDIKCELVCASQTKERRADALFNIESGNAQIIIGTHALFQESVKFKNLAFTVIDEQHRFGVEQRGNFENKGDVTDSLVMSATPIPRTLALTMYGDLDITTIHSLPSSKASIYTKFVPMGKESDMLNYIYRKSLEGDKAYIVCPRVDDEDAISAVQTYKKLQKIYGKTVGIIHGQMKEEEKNKAMSEFYGGNIRILVCTTVIEVGIDVSDAINIVIYNAERYGLSQLHQLRGRVGRGNKDGYCFIVYEGDSVDERLKYFAKNNNGFELAEYDFKQRGAGDFLGKRQHGESDIFGGINIDNELLEKAKNISEMLLQNNEIFLDCNSFKYIKGLTLN